MLDLELGLEGRIRLALHFLENCKFFGNVYEFKKYYRIRT